MKIGLCQINTTVGDFAGNRERILGAYRAAVAAGADLALAPELATTGYPPQDLLFKSRFVPGNLELLDELAAATGDIPLVIGYVDRNDKPTGRPFRNGAAVLHRGRVVARRMKSRLPTYDVFDEDRYFEPAESVEPVAVAGHTLGVTICEDIWDDGPLTHRRYPSAPAAVLVGAGATILLNLSASPYHLGKPAQRRAMLSRLAATHRVPLVYCNLVGGNDQLVFDGNSLAFDAAGQPVAALPPFREDVGLADLDPATPPIAPPTLAEPEELFEALALGLRDYVAKCGFRSAVLGLSGGIDSAVSAVIAAAALGPENVLGVALPTRYSSAASLADARALAANLGIRFLTIPIQAAFGRVRAQFAELFAGRPEDTTEENIQPRLRAVTLMALSNKFGHLLLTTGNKSELAVGYCTIYGDMAGGLAVISDVLKTRVYQLARWINGTLAPRRGRAELIPANTLSRPPSAELKPDQTDQDTLPPYDILDDILALYVEENLAACDIIARGHDERTVRWVVDKVDRNEYKRAQAAPGLKVTRLAFGLGRRMPIAQRFAG